MKHFLFVTIFISLAISQKGSKFSYTFNRPNFKPDVEHSLFSGIHNLNLNTSLNDNYNISFDAPFTAFSFDERETNDIDLANFTISFEKKVDNKVVYDFGISLPTAKENSDVILGLLANPQNMNKYLPNTLSLFSNFHKTINMFSYKIGPQIQIPTGDHSSDRDIDAILSYHFKVNNKINQNFDFLCNLEGVVNISDDLDFSDRFLNNLGLGLSYTINEKSAIAFKYLTPFESDLKEFIINTISINYTTTL